MLDSIIKIRNLSKTFDSGSENVEALKNISLDIKKGEIYGVIGLSGAGKSTLIRCINMLEKPTSGSVIIDGKEMTSLSKKELRKARREVTMIFQNFNLLMQRNCIQNVCFPMSISGLSRDKQKKRAIELLDLVGLSDKADSYPAQLSGGQKQRVAIARALATDPKVLLCDEATSALDPNTTASILDLLKELNQKLGVTMVIITHQMSVIEETCERVAIIDKGEIAEEGNVIDIFTNPRSEAARNLVYPKGYSSKERIMPGKSMLRVTFNGYDCTYDPLVASMAIDCGVRATILYADIRNISGRATGTMILRLPNDDSQIKRAKAYISSKENISYEEVEDRE